MSARLAGWPSLSLAAGCALLTGILVFVYALVCGFAWTRGAEAFSSAVAASAVCGVGALMALVVTGVTKSSINAPAGILAGMVLGMGLPLIAAAAFGFTGWLVTCFEIALIFETLIGVSVVSGRACNGRGVGTNSTQGVS
jgi:hypothetical protein